MGPTSPPTGTHPTQTAPFPSSRRSRNRPDVEYQLDKLEPRPEEVASPFGANPHLPRLRRPAPLATLDEPWESWHDRSISASSSSRLRHSPMFRGPPPPISASTLVSKTTRPARPTAGEGDRSRAFSSLVDQRPDVSLRGIPNSAWRGLRRKQAALEKHIQELLDFQAAALLRGSTGPLDGSLRNSADAQSDDGGSTPTDILLSTHSSGSRMPKSLYIPPRSTPDGNVIPVRQPSRSRMMGLHAARQSLQESLADLVDLKKEEYAHVDIALSERKAALQRLHGLSTRRNSIRNELKALEQDDEEPLGLELRSLEAENNCLDQEIRQLETKLVEMRNRRRWLKGRINDVTSKREAGLSGYRGALKDINAEVDSLMLRPPVQPLDQEVLGSDHKDTASAVESVGGSEFMRLIPQRRTVEMAKAWWEAEVSILEQQQARISEEQRALEEGGLVWQEVVLLVTDFEAKLRGMLEARPESSALSMQSGETETPQGVDSIQSHLARMDEVMEKLSQRMQAVEKKRWNLLICAIGAELEAFIEARTLFNGVAEDPEGVARDVLTDKTSAADEIASGDTTHDGHDESDNEVPMDLLVSRLDVAEAELPDSRSPKIPGVKRRDSGNDVPPEFLAEHDDAAGFQVGAT